MDLLGSYDVIVVEMCIRDSHHLAQLGLAADGEVFVKGDPQRVFQPLGDDPAGALDGV